MAKKPRRRRTRAAAASDVPQHIVFVVHGMGVHGDGWSDDWVEEFGALYDRYDGLSSEPIETRLQLTPIGYDGILTGLVKKWQTDASAIRKLAEGVEFSTADHLVGWLQRAKVDASFGWTHAADVLLYRCFKDVRIAVATHVARQMLDALMPQLERGITPRWSVVAHSLGTAVTHDALDMLFSSRLPNSERAPLNPSQHRADVVMMVANVSRVLETAVGGVYNSFVQPGADEVAGRGCRYYITARHRLDPFTTPKPFDPGDWPDNASVQQDRFRNIIVNHIHDANVHGFGHYLLHPKVHIPMFRLLCFDELTRELITDEEEQDAIDGFSDLAAADALGVKHRLEAIPASHAMDWTRLKELWDAYQHV